MYSFRQLLRRPWKTGLGILLSGLACAAVCVSLGQYIAAVQTRADVDNRYTSVGLLTNRYMAEEILDAENNLIGMTYAPEQPPEVAAFLQALIDQPPAYVKAVQQNRLASGYLPDTVPLNFIGEMALTTILDRGGANTTLEIAPYTCAMLAIQVEAVGEPLPYYTYYGYTPSLPGFDTEVYGNVVELTGTVLQAVSLQGGYPDPTGRTLRATVWFAGDPPALEAGQTYLLCGTDYSDSDMELRIELAFFLDPDSPADVDWANVSLYDHPKLPEVAAIYEDKITGGGIFLTESDLEKINCCSLTVCTNPLLYGGQLGEEEIALPNGETMSAAAYVETFRDGGIVRLDGSAEAFLAQTGDPFWENWLAAAQVNDHGFPVVGVDSLRAVSQFATLDAVLTQGRSFTQAELDAGAKVCVISEALAAANGLSLGDQMTIQYYETDGALNGNMVPQKLANPAAAYYSPRLGFSGEPGSYEIVGLYRQRDQWSYGTQSFTPNTVFVPNSVMPAGASSICGGIFTSVVLEHGTSAQLEQLASDRGLPQLFAYYDQGYSLIFTDLEAYSQVGRLAAAAGLALWVGIVLAYLFLFPRTMGPDLRRMGELGVPPGGIRRHIFLSSIGILLPGAILGGVAAALLFNRFTQYLTARAGVELSLTISAPTFCLIAAAQMLVVLAGAFAFARAPKPHGRRRG